MSFSFAPLFVFYNLIVTLNTEMVCSKYRGQDYVDCVIELSGSFNNISQVDTLTKINESDG